jgi:hypothetical protein
MLIKLIPFLPINVNISFSYPFVAYFRQLTISTTLVDVGGHGLGDVLGTNVALSTQQELDILFGGVKN